MREQMLRCGPDPRNARSGPRSSAGTATCVGRARQGLSQPDAHAEFQVAVDLLTTNETYFFREPAHFELLEKEIARTRPRGFAVWSAAASFGDEAYSAAMLLADRSCAAPAASTTPSSPTARP
jgi:chemotaxis methyl-accepting protein methylase